MYKRFLQILIGTVCCTLVAAQDFDLQTMSETDILGSARYVGMAGAMTAVGGDESAVRDNPAALGVFRRSAVSVSLNWQTEKAQSNLFNYNESIFRCPHFAIIFSFGNPQRYNGAIFNNLMFSYQRLKSFSRHSIYSGSFGASLIQQVADITNSNPNNSIIQSQLHTDWDLYNNPEIGWLSVLFAKEGLITEKDGKWFAIDGTPTYSELELQESGGVDMYDFSWGINISNRCYLGLGANLMSLTYGKTSFYYEEFSRAGVLDHYLLTSTLNVSGLGFMGNIGVIYTPLSALRLGLSWQSPTIYSMKFSNHSTTDFKETPVNSFTYNKYLTPMRGTAGMAFCFGRHGLLSAQYEYTHQFDKTISDVHTIKAGLEVVVSDRLFLRGGYAYEFNNMRSTLMPHYNDTRTDTEFRRSRRTHYITAGIGYRGRYVYTELAYRYRRNSDNLYAFAYQSEPFRTLNYNHAVVFSIGLHN